MACWDERSRPVREPQHTQSHAALLLLQSNYCYYNEPVRETQHTQSRAPLLLLQSNDCYDTTSRRPAQGSRLAPSLFLPEI